MVVINSLPRQNNVSAMKKILMTTIVLFFVYWLSFPPRQEVSQLRGEQMNKLITVLNRGEKVKTTEEVNTPCKYKSISDLKEQERMPSTSDGRHMIAPPQGGKVFLVCCDTTAGPLSIVAHEKWAPLGTERFLNMVKNQYFDSGVPFMRCVKGFLCQFGLNADPSKNGVFGSIKDDPNWLPEGPKFRENEDGVKRFPQGYLAYAGSGKNSRGHSIDHVSQS